MILKKVTINNFRSISECTIVIEKTYQVLVGINESGKSNILKAFSLINGDAKMTKNDIRDPTLDDENIEESYIRFVFSLESEDIVNIVEKLKEKIIAKNIKESILTIGDTDTNLKDFVKYKSEVLYNIDITKMSRYCSHWKMEGPKFRIKNHWKKFIEGKSGQIEINGENKNIKSFVIVNVNDYPEIDSTLLEDLDISTLNNFVGTQFMELMKKNVPNSTLWEYKESNLLPGKIDLSTFRESPETCLPLKIMFNLSGYDDIKKVLEDAENKTNGLKNTFKRVSERTTAHMKKVWPEWDKLNVSISQNGSYIEAGIQDEFNFYSLERRSDGFKRFFTFLLMISAQNKTKDLVGNIILIDEPEIGVHPKGQQFLSNEMIKIATQNIVLVSTHSIFMIDKEQIDRHILVKKEKEVTKIERVESSNIMDEEVVYKALGFSVFELLKPKNIIFEGWRDKRTFEMFIKSRRGLTIITKKDMQNIGLLHAVGVKDIARLANLCQNFGREYIIITDCDKPALEKQKDFKPKEKWMTYKDIQNVQAITTEDFISKTLINKQVKQVLKNYKTDDEIQILEDDKNGYMQIIEAKIKGILSSQFEPKKVLNDIKDLICENTKADELNEEYSTVVKEIATKIL